MQKRAAAAPFADDAEYLELACARVRARLERALAVAEGRGADADKQAEHAAALAVEIAARAESATAAVKETLGLPALQRRLGLDDADVDVLMHAAAAQLDPGLGKLHTKLSGTAFHPWLDVGLAVQMQHDGVADRLRARARFEPDAPLLRHRLVTLDRARPEAKDNLSTPARSSCLRAWRGSCSAATRRRARPPSRGCRRPTVGLDSVVLPDDARAELEQVLAAQPGLGTRLSEWGYDRAVAVGARGGRALHRAARHGQDDAGARARGAAR